MQEAKERFDKAIQLKERQKQDQIELAEKRQREIYLNGGYVDCVNSGMI